MIGRYYIRCTTCLAIGSVEEVPAPDWTCGICGGTVETMGKVTADNRLEREEERSACDGRCTSARGPLCVCHCKCANHGTGRTVTIVRDLGPAPRINFPENTDVQLAIASDYREALARVQAIAEQLRILRNQRYLSHEEYRRAYTVQATLRKARASRSHKSRMKYLQAIT